MADAAAPPPPPPFDPIEILGKIGSIVTGSKKTGGGGSSWTSTLVIIAVALAGIAIWSWVSAKRNRELAKLRHEAFVAKTKLAQDLVDALVKTNDEKIAASTKMIEKSQDDLRVITANIRAEESRYAADLLAIDRIRSWRDVDPDVR